MSCSAIKNGIEEEERGSGGLQGGCCSETGWGTHLPMVGGEQFPLLHLFFDFVCFALGVCLFVCFLFLSLINCLSLDP